MKPIRILLVEDNEGDIFLTTLAFEQADIKFTLSVVRDGKEAIDFLNQDKDFSNASLPQLILLDINLPKRNGHEVLKYVKEHEQLKHIPVIMLTTSSSQKDIEMSYSNGANSFITKSSEVKEFLLNVAGIVKRWIPAIVATS